MTATALRKNDPGRSAAALLAASPTLPWVPLSADKAFKPLRFLPDDRGFVELLRLQPGARIARHRHTGEVHAFNLQGWRELDSGERVGPGDYVYEAQGNVDSWRVIGDEALIVLVVVMGAVEYLDERGAVTRRYTAAVLDEIYRKHCASIGSTAADLSE